MKSDSLISPTSKNGSSQENQSGSGLRFCDSEEWEGRFLMMSSAFHDIVLSSNLDNLRIEA
jgi:hypothetical protein